MTEEVENSFEYHRKNGDISLDQHIKKKQIDLAADVSEKCSIYLDIRYWIILCETSLGRSKNEHDYELLSLVGKLVDDGLAFFPISESTFAELMKQSDLYTRFETAKLIDKFSTGVALIPYEKRVSTEIAHVLYSHMWPEKVYPLNMLVWTKVSNVLGEFIPLNPMFDEDAELVVQKSFFDHLWGIGLSEMVGRSKSVRFPTPNFESLAESLNKNNEKHSDELRSYEKTYFNEIAGVVDLYSDLAHDVLNNMAIRQGIPCEGNSETVKWVMNLFREAYRKGAINKSAPSLDVHARCHASVRWNKGRKIEANDIFDFNHAAAALGYSSAFFTERSLCNLLTEKKIELDKFHDCRVIFRVEDALVYLRTLG